MGNVPPPPFTFCYHLNMATGSLVGWQNFSNIFSFCCIKNLINKMKSSFVPFLYGYHFYLWGKALDARSYWGLLAPINYIYSRLTSQEWGHVPLIQIMNVTALIYIQSSRIVATLQHFIIICVTFRAWVLAENDSNDMCNAQSLASNNKRP